MTADRSGWPADPGERLRHVIHDLRTPLTIVEGFAQLMRRGGPDLDDARRAEYVERIAAAAEEMRHILDAERDGRPAE